MHRFAICLVIVLLFVPSIFADETIEGTLSKVSVPDLSITVETSKGSMVLDVLKKAPITISSKSATLQDLKPGYSVSVLLDSKIDTVVRINATGTPHATPTEIQLSELPVAHIQGSPWVSPDGLTLYWSAQQSKDTQRLIYSAKRQSKDEVFGEAKQVLAGVDFSLTADELQMIIFDKDGKLYSTSRVSKDRNFQRPAIIAMAQGVAFGSPRISENGLTLYIDKFGKPIEPHVCTRKSISDSWSTPVKVMLPQEFSGQIRSITLIGNGRYALACRQERPSSGNSIVILQSAGTPQSFNSGWPLQFDGIEIHGHFPHYSVGAKELYLTRFNAPSIQPEAYVFSVKDVDLATYLKTLSKK